MSMTPELIEEIKIAYKGMKEVGMYVPELLAALEDSQQRIGKLELYVKSLEFSRDEAQKKAHDIEREKGLELFEARQTIARQAKVMKEAGIALNAAQLLALFIENDGKPVDGFRFREIARNMMTLLELMDWSALGNKEGSD